MSREPWTRKQRGWFFVGSMLGLFGAVLRLGAEGIVQRHAFRLVGLACLMCGFTVAAGVFVTWWASARER